MHCGTCLKKFSLMRTRKQCSECRRYYCKYCVMRKANKNINCENCAVLTSRPLSRTQLLKLKARDLQLYLANKQISTKGCLEKDDLVNLLLAYANGTDFQSTANNSSSAQDSHSSGHHLFRNIRSLFTSTPDVSTNNCQQTRVPNPGPAENTSLDSTQSSPNTIPRICFNQVPPYHLHVQQQEQTTVAAGTECEPNEASGVNSSDAITVNSDPSSEYLSQPQSLNELTRNLIDAHGSESDSTLTLDNVILTASERELIENIKDLNLSDIKEISELDILSIQQLKYLLMRNRVDFKGCVEKTELLERVKRLWTEYSQSREGIDNLSIDDLCKICMDAPIECVMLECGHMATCTSCGKQLSECPICRQYVVRVVRTFRV